MEEQFVIAFMITNTGDLITKFRYLCSPSFFFLLRSFFTWCDVQSIIPSQELQAVLFHSNSSAVNWLIKTPSVIN